MENVSQKGWWSEDLSESMSSLEQGGNVEVKLNSPYKRPIRFEDGQLEVLYLV